MKTLARPVLLFVCTLLLLPLFADTEASAFGRLYRDRLEIGRALIEVQYDGLAEVIPYYAHDIEYHDPIVDIYGIDMMTEFLYRLFGSSPDLITTIEDETLVGSTYSATWTMVGQFNGVPYSAKGISVIEFRGRTRKVMYQRDYYSENDIMINIPGLDQAAIGFRTFYRCAVDPTFDCPLKDGVDKGNSMIVPPFPPGHPGNNGRPFRLRRERLEVGRALLELNADNWTEVLPYLAENYEYHDPIVDIYGPGTMAEFLGRLFASSSDLITTVEDETLIGDIYMATWTMAGMFNGVPFSAPGMSIVKFEPRSAMSYYSRDYYTEGDIMINIPGLDEPAEAFRVYYRCAVDPSFDCPLPPPGLAATGDKADTPAAADAFRLRQNVPNPFNPVTEIAFDVPREGANVSLRIYDVSGRLIRTLVQGYQPSGTRTVTWTGTDDQGRAVSSGTYFYQLTAPTFSERKKMVLLR